MLYRVIIRWRRCQREKVEKTSAWKRRRPPLTSTIRCNRDIHICIYIPLPPPPPSLSKAYRAATGSSPDRSPVSSLTSRKKKGKKKKYGAFKILLPLGRGASTRDVARHRQRFDVRDPLSLSAHLACRPNCYFFIVSYRQNTPSSRAFRPSLLNVRSFCPPLLFSLSLSPSLSHLFF